MKFYQACYGKPGNNWELLNISQDAPSSLVSAFERHGKACTPEGIGEENTVYADGRSLCLYELVVDENAVCVLRAQYGERDSFGRPKMFAHGFMFEAEGLLCNPNDVLTIADSNFKFSADATRMPPAELAFEEPFSVGESLATLEIERDTWIKLMGCIYILLSSPTDFPLYVVCKNDLRAIKSAIYCILSALPYQLRYQLSFSNANSFQYAKFKRVMFVEKVPGNEYYFSLATGESNINLSEIDNSPEKYPAYHTFANQSDAEFEQYCKLIQKVASEMGYFYNARYEDVIMADMVLRGTDRLQDKDETELTKYLIEILKCIPQQNTFIDDYMAKVLHIFQERDYVLNDAIMQRIEHRSEGSQSTDFVEIYKKLKMRFLLSHGVDEIVSFLNQQYDKSRALFDDWCVSILQIKDGNDVIALFHQERIMRSSGFVELYNCCVESKEYWRRPELKEVAKKRCVKIACRKTSMETLHSENYKQVLKEFEELFVSLFPDAPQNEISNLDIGIKKYFWQHFDYSMFEFEQQCIANCKIMAKTDEPQFAIVNQLIALYEMTQKYRNGVAHYHDVEWTFDELFENCFLKEEEIEVLAPKVRQYICSSLFDEGDHHFCAWAKFASFGNADENPLLQMIDWELPVICNETAFIEAFQESERMVEMCDTILQWMIGNDQKSGVVAALEPDPERVKIIKREAKYLLDYKKQMAAAEKSREKEQRKMEKLERKKEKEFVVEEDDESLQNTLFASEEEDVPTSKKKGFFSLFDKKK